MRYTLPSRKKHMRSIALALALSLIVFGCAPSGTSSNNAPTAADAKEGEELTKIAADMDGEYGKGKWCEDPKKPDTCLDINKITDIMRESRDEKKLRQVWEGWHTISPPMRKQYTRFVELSNKGAKELGFPDTGAMWRSKYDMPPDAYSKEVDRLWDQVRPLYLKLHAYVRMKLRQKYGDAVP